MTSVGCESVCHSIAGIRFGTTNNVIVFFTLGFLGEPLPLLGHFSEECLEPRINRSAGLLKAPRGKSSVGSCALHLSHPWNQTAFD
jgi:hypothetical protein